MSERDQPSNDKADDPLALADEIEEYVAEVESDGVAAHRFLSFYSRVVATLRAMPSAGTFLPWSPEETAKRFHDAYELFAPAFGWATQETSRKPWDDLPHTIKSLMIAVVRNVLIEQAGATQSASTSTADELAFVEAGMARYRAGIKAQAMDAMVDRFLSWPLPESVCADGCATNPNYPHQRSGTNLLTAVEARAMLEHVLSLRCPYCTSDNEAIRSTYYDQTCKGCVERMGRP